MPPRRGARGIACRACVARELLHAPRVKKLDPRSALVLALLLPLGCTPSPRNVPCSNDLQCEQANEEFTYCLQGRCVECVGSASCGDARTCADGDCRANCKDNRSCAAGETCSGGLCTPN